MLEWIHNEKLRKKKVIYVPHRFIAKTSDMVIDEITTDEEEVKQLAQKKMIGSVQQASKHHLIEESYELRSYAELGISSDDDDDEHEEGSSM